MSQNDKPAQMSNIDKLPQMTMHIDKTSPDESKDKPVWVSQIDKFKLVLLT